MILLQVDFKYTGPTGTERDKALEALAHSITGEPVFVWKIWTEDAGAERAGGIYFFRSRKDAEPISPYMPSGCWRGPASAICAASFSRSMTH